MENQKIGRRSSIQITTGGLIHLAASPLLEASDDVSGELLIRRAKERGHTDIGWLKSYHSFSFGGYFDPEHMGFRSLRVINDDKISGGKGFPTHPHRDMEIISYVIEGALEHRDNTGTGSIIRPNEIQYMAAGTGITHSEFNPSKRKKNHFLQVWIAPNRRGAKPRYAQEKMDSGSLENGFTLIASREGTGKSIEINQDAKVFAARPQAGQKLEYTLEKGRHGWFQVATGEITVNGTLLKEGDAIASSRATRLVIEQAKNAEVLFFDLA